MVDGVAFDGITIAQSLSSCLFLAIFYVLVFYIKKSPYSRDHPETIKLRSFRAIVVCILSPFFVLFWSHKSSYGVPIWRWIGIHTTGIINATFLPLILTMLLFAGPLTMMYIQNELPFMSGSARLNMDLVALRNFVVNSVTLLHSRDIQAPLTEEVVYRACMIPLLVPSFGLTSAVFICPLLFGVAHFHHAIERIQLNERPLNVLFATVFQFSYTSAFGVYSAFVFVRTGHLIGPFVCHSFCNYMGIPEFHLIPDTKYPKFVGLMFVVGLISFVGLLKFLTDPTLYNSIYFK